MTALAMPAPLVQVPVPPPGVSGDPHQPPAPVATMLAVVGRVASHAGDPLSITVTEPTHTIAAHVPTHGTYVDWCRELDTAATVVTTDTLGTLVRASAMVHGWRVDVQLVGQAA
ncbi:hypothetical protein [Micromonospora sp. NPDC049645]|uniref:hypothetical protein n=1 Tax=Micromonospora sp. NPDC049645 TaxID=3155508 RepID=UPI00343869C7